MQFRRLSHEGPTRLYQQARLLTHGSSYSPRLPDILSVAFFAAFITVYSCGAVRDLHPLPYYPFSP